MTANLVDFAFIRNHLSYLMKNDYENIDIDSFCDLIVSDC